MCARERGGGTGANVFAASVGGTRGRAGRCAGNRTTRARARVWVRVCAC